MHISQFKQTLFDSGIADLTLGIEGVFEKTNPQTQFVTPNIYTTQRGNCSIAPSVYITFAFKQKTTQTGAREERKVVYTSFPQIPGIYRAIDKIKSYLETENAFVTDPDGKLIVNPTYEEPCIIDHIGKEGKFISFKLSVAETVENGITNAFKGVEIRMSEDMNRVAVLNEDEFLSVYYTLKNINLVEIANIWAVTYILQNEQLITQQSHQNSGYQQQPVYNQGYSQQSQYNNTAPAAPQPRYNQGQSGYQSAPRAPKYNQQQNLPPRQQQAPKYNQQPQQVPTMNSMIEETPVMDVDLDDSAAIDDIFNGN